MQKQLRKPSNWQDFETLCEILWGEIWNYPEIKKNGRSGQNQNGIDIIGKLNGDYIGIQCKGKDESLGSKLSKAEIDLEVEKAITFKPALKKMYFATTADKDVLIEEYVRLKDEENQKKGLFEIHLFSWGDISGLIDRNKKTHDFYVKSQQYQTNYSADFGFKEGIQIVTSIKRIKHIRSYRHKPIEQPELPKLLKHLFDPKLNNLINTIQKTNAFRHNRVNQSFINFSLCLNNYGSSPITDYKIEVEFKEGIIDLKFDNVYEREIPRFDETNFRIKKVEQFKWQINPRRNVLVPEDKEIYNSFSIRPTGDEGTIHLHWKLLSSQLTKEGKLSIVYKSDNYIERKYEIISTDLPERDEINYIDYFE
ncbi:hypothetical protein [Pedobacter sp. B4-66]|uniref:restriction endonuclease n=1 Tax=Pedobacter sp. B4-66 TaxID=2817280 RepID=UPI001BDA48A8|nr:hypothetical protein [Pedobacter sp. B4-66]